MDWIHVFKAEDLQQLHLNWKENLERKGTHEERDFHPAVKLFLPWASATWLLTEMDDDGLAFGLADLGFGTPELGYISMDEIYSVKGPGGLRVEQDIHWRANKPLSSYAIDARQHGRIRG
ncbi:MAG: hypothetical protein BGP16_00990 [Sphingobium sp. 66-54]|nr:MAG: hypothetical protein BGP16_00990 [Sphingobium sp. 66-54]